MEKNLDRNAAYEAFKKSQEKKEESKGPKKKDGSGNLNEVVTVPYTK